MPAFNLEHERQRVGELQEIGTSYVDQIRSVDSNLKSYLLERNGALSPFNLTVNGSLVQQDGYSHRGNGDLDASFQLSEKAATEDRIEKRYRLENEGFGEVKKRFFDLPLGSTILLMSPPPEEPIPGYPGHSMAYFYHILPDSEGDKNKRTIKALSWVNYFSKSEQAELLNDLGAEEEVSPTEESILKHPIFALGREANILSFQKLWDKIGESYVKKEREQDFRYVSGALAERYLLDGEAMWEKYHGNLALMTTNLAQRLISGETNAELAIDWDIMLNVADQEFTHVDITSRLPKSGEWNSTLLPGKVIFEEYQDYSYAPRVATTMCGESAGIGTYSETGSFFMTATYIVENFTGENAKNDPKLCRCKGEKPHFHCDGKSGRCKHAVIVGKGITSCSSCGKGKVC